MITAQWDATNGFHNLFFKLDSGEQVWLVPEQFYLPNDQTVESQLEVPFGYELVGFESVFKVVESELPMNNNAAGAQ